MTGKRFKRTKENFVCINCLHEVEGNGYTDHCPKCLVSLHVDVNPGDRAESCRGVMEPVAVTRKGDCYIINYVCKKCGHKYRVKSNKEDNIDKIIEISGNFLNNEQ